MYEFHDRTHVAHGQIVYFLLWGLTRSAIQLICICCSEYSVDQSTYKYATSDPTLLHHRYGGSGLCSWFVNVFPISSVFDDSTSLRSYGTLHRKSLSITLWTSWESTWCQYYTFNEGFLLFHIWSTAQISCRGTDDSMCVLSYFMMLQGGSRGLVRSWVHLADAGVLMLNIHGNRWCGNIDAEHKSNGVFYVGEWGTLLRNHQTLFAMRWLWCLERALLHHRWCDINLRV